MWLMNYMHGLACKCMHAIQQLYFIALFLIYFIVLMKLKLHLLYTLNPNYDSFDGGYRDSFSPTGKQTLNIHIKHCFLSNTFTYGGGMLLLNRLHWSPGQTRKHCCRNIMFSTKVSLFADPWKHCCRNIMFSTKVSLFADPWNHCCRNKIAAFHFRLHFMRNILVVQTVFPSFSTLEKHW